jgi:hypothetical protein
MRSLFAVIFATFAAICCRFAMMSWAFCVTL